LLGHTAASSLARTLPVAARPRDELRVGLVGCGQRGTGAAAQALAADPDVRLVALADAFAEPIESALANLRALPEIAARVAVEPAQRFVGLDGFRGVLAADVDVVLLATPPHFRPLQARAAIEAGKHVFAEKPAAVDAPGVRSLLETAALAREKKLSFVAGLNLRYLKHLQEAVRRVQAGAIGELRALEAVRYGSNTRVRARAAGMTEMQYQVSNWHYFTWLSGDFISEQFVHQLDLAAWLMGERYPVRCIGTGGRQVRTEPEYGHIFDHFTSIYEFENGARLFATTRQQDGCSDEMSTHAVGTKGSFAFDQRGLSLTGENPWQPPREPPQDLHQPEMDAFFGALREGRALDNGDYMAKSSLMAILGRMACYTGRSLSWEQAFASKEELRPSAYTWDATPPEAKVALPGITPFF
jgi:myo-inositol 2-dehydrogenase / D-chiro-inositol 1-dehydrogenase